MAERTTMRGRVCLVTGATAGIGAATAHALAERGATVLMVGRNREKGERVRERIRAATANPEVELLLCDFASLAQVQALADSVRQRHERLDVLVNNAGVFTRERTTTADGLETQFAVNHLAPFLLTTQLLDLLRASAPARVINVSSEAHRGARLAWDDLQGERRYSGFRAYGASKLANVLFTRELSRRVAGFGVTANALHPGVIGTDLLFGFTWLVRLARPFLKTPEEGARTTVFLATDPGVASTTGGYFKESRPAEPAAAARDPEAARRLWEVSEQLVRRSLGAAAP